LQKDKWEDLTNILNGSAEGPKKSAEEWRKVEDLEWNLKSVPSCAWSIGSIVSFLSEQWD